MKKREPNHWSVKSNPTLARNREPNRRYAISSLTSAEERKLDCRFAYTNPMLIQHRQADDDLLPTLVRRHPADWAVNVEIFNEDNILQFGFIIMIF